jgi:hypothetical protein
VLLEPAGKMPAAATAKMAGHTQLPKKV